jgi:myo-inositol 2-dehydrogenase/D-chiro-inositol 1-dehydrogenase
MTIRVGIVGVGVMGADHARTLATQVPGAHLHAVQDADAARAAAVAQETGAGKSLTDPLALIADPAIDAVLIASPDATHRDFTRACLAAGKPVLCEKPLAPTARECLEIVAAEAALGRRLVQVGYMRRFDPAYVELKAKLGSGRLGRALMFHCQHRNVAAPAWFTADMAIGNSAVHEFDIARWVLDADMISVQAFKPRGPAPGAAVGPVFILLESALGQLVDIEVFNNAAYGYDVRGELVCETGTVALAPPVRTVTNATLVHGADYPADWRPHFADAYRLQLQAWIKSIETGHPVGASAWDGYVAAAIAEAGQESLARGQRVAIKLAPRPVLYPAAA